MTKEDFTGLMRSLNLDEGEFKPYNTDFDNLPFQEVAEVKNEIETQLDLLATMLDQYNADMDTKLITSDGFPREDIDVVSIRLIRVKVIRLRNDHKQVLKALETKMIEEFATRKDDSVEKVVESPKFTIPFARVGQVVVNSPAHRAGLKEGDRIVLFDDDVHATNNANLTILASRVKNKVDRDIKVQLLRGIEEVELTLVPTNNWDGQGLLGCRLVPL